MVATVNTFTVEGQYPFPTDMLRYDQCWPATDQDASAIATACSFQRHTEGRQSAQVFSIKLVNHGPRAATTGRWISFGWRVLNQESRRI